MSRPDGRSVHPDRASLERFMAGTLAPSAGARILAHLLSDCPECRRVTAPLAPFGRAPLPELDDIPPEVDPLVTGASKLAEMLRSREQAFAAERARTPALLAELEGRSHANALLLVRNSNRFSTWSLAELLIDESFRHRFDDPARSRELAELAVEVAERLDRELYGTAAVNDLRARALAMRGNAMRVGSDLRGAGRCLTRALELLEEGSGDPLEEARVCELFAALRSDQRRVGEALRFQQRAMRLYRRAGEQERLGQALVSLASYQALAGERERAISLIEQALPLLDAEHDPHVVLAARHNLAVFLQESGRLREALGVLAEVRGLYDSLGDRLNLLRLRWLEGRLARELGDLARAEQSFEEVCRGFTEAKLPIDAAHAALDLAALYLESGRAAKVYVLVVGVEAVFRTQQVEREALAAWILLREAAATETVHQALLREVAARLDALRDGVRR